MSTEPSRVTARVVRATGSAPETRCPFCHDDAPDSAGFKLLSGPVRERFRYCAACRAVHHAECWSEGGGCSACGRHFDAIPSPLVPRAPRPVASVESVVAAAEEWRAGQPRELSVRSQLARIMDANRPAPRHWTRRRALSLAGQLLVGGALSFLLLNVAGTGLAYLLCRSERARIENSSDVALARIVEWSGTFEFGRALLRDGRDERVEASAREVARQRARALDSLRDQYGGMAGVRGEQPLFRARLELARARIHETLARELATLAAERARAGLPHEPDRSWAAPAEARAQALESDLDSILPLYESTELSEDRAHPGARTSTRWWPVWWHFGWPGG